MFGKECEDKNCAKRHRRQCRHGSICSFLKKNKCEYKHDQTKLIVDNQAKNIRKEADLLKTETLSLKLEIIKLKKTIADQQSKLDKITNDHNVNNNSTKQKQDQLEKQNKELQKNIKEIRLEYEACLTKLKADSTSKDSAIKALHDNLSEETSRNDASL